MALPISGIILSIPLWFLITIKAVEVTDYPLQMTLLWTRKIRRGLPITVALWSKTKENGFMN